MRIHKTVISLISLTMGVGGFLMYSHGFMLSGVITAVLGAILFVRAI